MTSEEYADSQVSEVLPPNDTEAELGILGCIMLEPYECIYECIEAFGDGAEAFYDLKNRVVYDAMVKLAEKLEPIDALTLNTSLRGTLSADGGLLLFLSSLADKVPSASNLSAYISIVQGKYALRKVIKLCQGIVNDAMKFTGEVGSFIDEAQGRFLTATQANSRKTATQVLPVVQRVMTRIESYRENPGDVVGVPSGFTDIDQMTGGFRGSELIIIAARPAEGKSACLMNIAEYAAIEKRLPVLIFSLEMSAEQLVERLICSRGRVNLRSIRNGYMSERDITRIAWAAGNVGAAPIYIDDSAGLSILELRARARRMIQMYGIKMIGIDYLQLMRSTEKRAHNRQQEIGDISRGLKQLAKEQDIPVVALAQLSRGVEKDGYRMPRLSDLRESGDIEQDADTVGMLYRPGEQGEESENPYALDVITVNFLLAKQRQGPTGIVPLTFTKSQTRFSSQTRRVEPEEQSRQPELGQQPELP